MFKVEIESSKFKNLLNTFVEKFSKSATDEIEATVKEIQSQMQVPGKPVTYPIQWDSDKQRMFVMAKLRRENNLPYKRTGAYVNGWKVSTLPNGYSISNTSPAGAIGGTLKGSPSLLAQGGQSLSTWQSKIHRGRWPLFLVVVAEQISQLPKRVIDRLRLVIGK